MNCPLRLPKFRLCNFVPVICVFVTLTLSAVINTNASEKNAAPRGVSETRADSVEPTYLTNVRQVTDGFEKAGEGYFSPDGQTIVYQAIRREYPFYQIYTQPLDGDRPKLISTGRGRTTCSYFSPDGERLLFASSHLDPNLYDTEEQVRQQQAEDRRTGRRPVDRLLPR